MGERRPEPSGNCIQLEGRYKTKVGEMCPEREAGPESRLGFILKAMGSHWRIYGGSTLEQICNLGTLWRVEGRLQRSSKAEAVMANIHECYVLGIVPAVSSCLVGRGEEEDSRMVKVAVDRWIWEIHKAQSQNGRGTDNPFLLSSYSLIAPVLRQRKARTLSFSLLYPQHLYSAK